MAEWHNISFSLLNRPAVCSECMSTLERIASEPLPCAVFRSGYVPSPDQAAEIKNFDESFEVVHGYTTSIMKRRALQDSLLSPIRKLPDELLCKIFGQVEYKSLYHSDKPDGIDMGNRYGIWAVRGVCAHWRNVAEASQELWTTFSYGNNMERISWDALERRTKLCLQFSGSALLSVTITPNRYYLPQQVFYVLMDHANKLYKLAIDLHSLRNHHGCNEKLQPPEFSHLRILCIEDSCTQNQDGEYFCHNFPFDFFECATSLEEVEMKGVNMDGVNQLTLNGVKSLTLSGFCRSNTLSNDFEYTLPRLLPQLQSLTWVDINNREREEAQKYGRLHISPLQPPVDLPFVHSLHVGIMGKMWCTKVLVPNLTNFTLSAECFHNTKRFVSMIQKSGCTLKSVDINLCSEKDYKEVFKHLPENEDLTLSITYTGVGITNLNYLIWNSNRHQLLPKLKKLILTIDLPMISDLETLQRVVVDIMQSRSLKDYHMEPNALSEFQLSVAVPRDFVDKASLPRVSSAGKELGMQVQTTIRQAWWIRPCKKYSFQPDDED